MAKRKAIPPLHGRVPDEWAHRAHFKVRYHRQGSDSYSVKRFRELDAALEFIGKVMPGGPWPKPSTGEILQLAPCDQLDIVRFTPAGDWPEVEDDEEDSQ